MKPFIVFCKLPLFLFFLSFLLQHSHSQQSYVNNNQLACYESDEVTNGYVCVNSNPSCVSYLTFRAQAPYDSASQIGHLLNADPTTIAQLNNITDVDQIPTNTLIIVPISNCSCSGIFYQHNTTYTLNYRGENYFTVANDTLQGLSSCQALMNANPYDSRNLSVGMTLEVPLRCACPTRNQIDQGFQFLLSYLVTWRDDIPTISEAFGVDEQSTRGANQLSATNLIFPFTTLLIPLRSQPTYRPGAQSPPASSPPTISIPGPEDSDSSSSDKKGLYIGIGIGSVLLVAIVLALLYLFLGRHPSRTATQSNKGNVALMNESQSDELELPLFNFPTIATATDEFSFSNKIGQGGFGPVYKGILPAGEEIAIKRLSKDSRQGLEEFMNEVILIAKLQHRNLVRLLGCCIQGDDRMLIYEYMPNKSLDFFIFDKTRSANLNWKKRFDIIVGIARGLLYLHRDSRLRIIHRDLKAANVLLDSEMNPKISDFGMARTFGANQTEENTLRVVGTYGYMSPEYAIEGLFSMKSDVFSFGVIVLEIVSGKRNRGFHHADHDLNLLGHTWTLLKDNRALEIMDASMKDSFTFSEGLKCIQVGLLCVQKFPEDRPSMSTVISMLDGDGTNLPYPKQPGFYTERSPFQQDSSCSQDKVFTKNEATITILEGR